MQQMMTKERLEPLFCQCPGKTGVSGTRLHKHEVIDGIDYYTCQACGSRKRRRGPVRREFEERLDAVLFMEDKPKQYKPEGTTHKTAEGAHRPDKGTEFTQMEPDHKFLLKADAHKLA